jgi:NAD(P)-dependent dehydrogenase (short-subunit alcohol dehydrogenase family)
VAADLGSEEGHAKLVAAEPHADIVISNLGIFQPADFFETDDAVWDRHWQVNVMAGVRLARSYLPCVETNGWGRFILLGSKSAFNIPVDIIHYGVSKIADVALARGLAKRMAGCYLGRHSPQQLRRCLGGNALVQAVQLRPSRRISSSSTARA